MSDIPQVKMPTTAQAAIVCAIFAAAKSFLLPMGMGLGLLLSGGRDGIVPGTSGMALAEWNAVAYSVCIVLLVAGVARLTAGTRAGQVLLITACLLTVVATLVEGYATLTVEGDAFPLLTGSIFGVLPAMLGAVFAATPSTSDWIAARSG